MKNINHYLGLYFMNLTLMKISPHPTSIRFSSCGGYSTYWFFFS